MSVVKLACVCTVQYGGGLPEGSELLTVSSYVRSVKKKERVTYMSASHEVAKGKLSNSMLLTQTNQQRCMFVNAFHMAEHSFNEISESSTSALATG